MNRESIDAALRQVRAALEAASVGAPAERAAVQPILEAISTAQAELKTESGDLLEPEALRRRARELEQAVAARDEFIATVAHELRNPISPLVFQVRAALMRMEQATGEAVPAEWVRSQFSRFEHRLHRLLETLDRVLDASRLSTGRIDLELEIVDLGSVMREVAAAFDAELAVARCELRYDQEGEATGLWDRVRLEQVCRNLLSNAIRYGAGRPVEVTVVADDQHACLEVCDHGIGIAPEHQQRIFERFERAGAESRSGGFGIGLWVVRNICAVLGGTVSVNSEVGRGARFRVVLPRRLDRAEKAEREA